MIWSLAVASILLIIFLYGNYNKKKKLKKLKIRLVNNWGKPLNKKYFNFTLISKYFKNNSTQSKAYQVISDKTALDLDIDAIFKFIDRTYSKIGQQYLYFKLRTIENKNNLIKFDTLSNFFIKNKNHRINTQIQLSQLNSNESYYLEELINGEQIKKPKIINLIYLLSISSLITIILAFFYPIFSLLLIPIFIINTIFHYKNKENINYYISGVKQLSIALKVSKSIFKIPQIKAIFKDNSFIKEIDAIKFKTEFIAFEKKFNNEFTALFWLIIELMKIIFNIEYIVFFSFIDSINKSKKEIEKMFVFIGKIDAAISVASLKADSFTLCTPQFTKEKEIVTSEIYHPLIKNGVSNNLNLSNNSILLTGSNMSGKTTFIRTIAINSLLAQTINICFAKKYTAPFFKIYSSIRITDNLLQNTSYYLEEVLTIKNLIKASENNKYPCLFILDEIFKGTNTVERISAGKAILSYLNKEKHIVIVSTHDIELTELLEKENYKLYHFSEQINNNILFFDHKLKKGKLKTKNAIKILELYKYPNEIITNAKKIEKKFG